MKKLSVLIILILVVSVSVFGAVWANASERGYEENGDSNQKSGNNQIKTLVIIGAGYFLKSHSNFQLFLNKIELSELSGANYKELQEILNAAIFSMENVRNTYFDLRNLAAATPYNQGMIDQLKNFNYKTFLEEQNLNREIFAPVKSLLSEGNVTGVYEVLFSDAGKILADLYTVKQSIDKDIFPELSNLWELNQKYSSAQLFGQYTTMVFYALK